MNAPLPDISYSAALEWLRSTRKYMLVRGPHGFFVLNHAAKRVTDYSPTKGHAAMHLYKTVKPANVNPPLKGSRVFPSRQNTSHGLRSVDCSTITR